jgi:hypothetical protein
MQPEDFESASACDWPRSSEEDWYAAAGAAGRGETAPECVAKMSNKIQTQRTQKV